MAGVLAGLAAATKYNFGVVLALPLAAAAGPPESTDPARIPLTPAHSARAGACPGARHDSRFTAAGYPVLVLGGFALGLIAGMPEIVTSPTLVLRGIGEQARLGSIHWNGQSTTPIWQLYADTLVRGLGWPTLLLAGGGAVALARRDRCALVALLSVPSACLAVMLRQELFFTRFALPLLPSLAVLSGLGMEGLARLVGRRFQGLAGIGIGLGALLIVLLPAGSSTIRLDQLATTTDTRILAQRWLEQHAGGTRVVTETYGLPVSWSGGAPTRGYRLQRVAALVDPAIVRRQACAGTRYFLTSSLIADHGVPRHAPDSETGYDLLTRLGRIAVTFQPFRPGVTASAPPDDTGIPFWYLDAYARPGPVVTVFELPGGAISCP